MDNIAVLERFGLAKNDIKIYDTLLNLGRSKTGAIIEQSGVVSSRVYESLRNLTKKGLVSYQVKNNVKYYKAELPDQLIHDVEKDTDTLKKLSKEIKDLEILKPDRNIANVYEGYHGFKAAFNQHTEAIEKNEEVCIIAFGSDTSIKTPFIRSADFFENIDSTVFSKTRNVRMLADKEGEVLMKKKRSAYKKYTLRILPKGYFSPSAINISAREVMISVWGDKPIVFTIKNPVAVASFKKNFEFLWKQAEK
jgi:sugar-specific transcriptional regulator TrmB